MRLTGTTAVTLVVAAVGCTRSTGELSMCSADAIERLRAAGATEEVIRKTCPPAAGVEPAAPQPVPSPTTWKVEPTLLSVIKSDAPSHLGKPTLVYVVLRPSDYFNYGYSNARNTHLSFEMASMMPSGEAERVTAYGYAERTWAKPFFDDVVKAIADGGGQFDSVYATLVVAYSKKRYDGRSADHIEILGASQGQKFDMDPAAYARGKQGAAASSAVDWSGFDIARFLKRTHFGEMSVNIASAEVVSEGVTDGHPAAILKVKYSVRGNFVHQRFCSYFHVAYNSEWKEFQNIFFSYVGNDEVKSEQCSWSAPRFEMGPPFISVVKKSGFSGPLPEEALVRAASRGKPK